MLCEQIYREFEDAWNNLTIVKADGDRRVTAERELHEERIVVSRQRPPIPVLNQLRKCYRNRIWNWPVSSAARA